MRRRCPKGRSRPLAARAGRRMRQRHRRGPCLARTGGRCRRRRSRRQSCRPWLPACPKTLEAPKAGWFAIGADLSAVELLALRGVAEDFIRGVHLGEALGRLGIIPVLIRMGLLRRLAKRLFDIGGRRWRCGAHRGRCRGRAWSQGPGRPVEDGGVTDVGERMPERKPA